MANTISFFGAARTVTGSKHLIETNGKKILVDCGLFQGPRDLRDRNWQPFPFDPLEIDAVVLTHGHTDHIGMLPKLIRDGYKGPIYCTKATKGLCDISLPDSGRLQEEDAYHANKHGSRHSPALPLYTEDDAYRTLKQLKPLTYQDLHALPGKAQFRYRPAGHILGSAFVELFFENGERILMSGDVGRYNSPIIKDPSDIDFTEYLVVESTYGDRLHEPEDPKEYLLRAFQRCANEGGVLLIPSFAIGRTQELLFHLKQLEIEGRLPKIPIYVDSPMATSTSALYDRSREEWDAESLEMIQAGFEPIEPDGLRYVRDKNQSKALNVQSGPFAVIAGSGMANGGRILHHLMHRLDKSSTTVLFVGYQAVETLGRRLLEGAPTVTIFRQEIEVRATIERMTGLSAHADQGELMRWLHGIKTPPKKTFIVHGEPDVQDIFAAKIREELGWDNVIVPDQGDSFDLS
jgi:metallo-beta-lactamase family protein